VDRLRNTYGVDGTPYFRPPYGLHNADTDRVAADLGYTTIALWSATVGDSRPENEKQLVNYAETQFQPQQIVLVHANLPTITHTYAQLLDIITTKGLQTVTPADVFSRGRFTACSTRAASGECGRTPERYPASVGAALPAPGRGP
jgi:peptidoglycan/xylan/chitin deacetylase (PgdA/CDA1 family)